MSVFSFSGQELIDLAVTIEKKGEELYRRLAAKSDDLQLSQLFHGLAEEEKQHQGDFTKLGERLKGINFPESYPGEYQGYVSSIVGNHLVHQAKDVEELLADITDEKSALQLALYFEKDSLLFFNELSNMVQGKDKEVLQVLIKTEQNHINRLMEVMKNKFSTS